MKILAKTKNNQTHFSQNPKWMKEKFTLCIETLHANDCGDQENVSTDGTRTLLMVVLFLSLFLFGFLVHYICAASMFTLKQIPKSAHPKNVHSITLKTVN